MQLNQPLTNEKTSFMDFINNRNGSYQEQNQLFLYISHFYQFLINKFPFSLIKQVKFKQLNEIECVTKSSNNNLRFEISAEKMNELLTQRQICVTDIRCLDSNSKQCLKNLCLKTCLYNLNSQQRENSNMLTQQYHQEKTKFLRSQYD